MKQDIWNMFELTGSIDAYMLYNELNELPEENLDEIVTIFDEDGLTIKSFNNGNELFYGYH